MTRRHQNERFAFACQIKLIRQPKLTARGLKEAAVGELGTSDRGIARILRTAPSFLRDGESTWVLFAFARLHRSLCEAFPRALRGFEHTAAHTAPAEAPSDCSGLHCQAHHGRSLCP